MRKGFIVSISMAGFLLAFLPAGAQTPAYKAPRTKDGKPNLNGIWQALNNANWNIEAHASSAGLPALGAQAAAPPDPGIVEGGEIPYLPTALAKRKENFTNRFKEDPEVKCYMAGVPRANYMGHPFQIIQGAKEIMLAYQYAGAVRIVNMGAPTKAPAESWMGWSNGHWEGETLVIDVTSLNDLTWFDRSGNFHSDKLHVVERYTPRSADTLMYEATIEDPKTFSRPWKISMPLYRHVEKSAKIMEFNCTEYSEEVLYGHLRKKQ